jgi:hypothetical protein
MSQYQNDPIIQLPNLYINGLLISNNTANPNTRIEIAQGIARDSQNVMDLCVGLDYPNVQNVTVSAPLIVSTDVTGAGGLDQGTIAANSVYAVYVIGDSRYNKTTAGMISLASNSVPSMPFKYDSYRLIGYIVTDGSSNIRPMYFSGIGNSRIFSYNTPVAVLTAGTQTTYTNINLSAFVPPVDNTSVTLNSAFTAAAAGNTANFKGALQTGDAVTIVAPVAGATAVTNSQNSVLTQNVTNTPRISYKVSAGSITVSIANFYFYV